MSSDAVSDEGVPHIGSISLDSMSPPAGSPTPRRGISGELARSGPELHIPHTCTCSRAPRHRTKRRPASLLLKPPQNQPDSRKHHHDRITRRQRRLHLHHGPLTTPSG